MRIIAGRFRSRKIYSPPDDTVTRPIPDRVKESLFSILRGHCEEALVFDGFAGSGAIGLEALSRGARRCVFVERHRQIGQLLSANIELLGLADQAEVFIGDVLGAGALSRCEPGTHLIFLDPPYSMIEDPSAFRRLIAQMARLGERLDQTGFLVLRTPWPAMQEVQEPMPEGTARRRVAADLRIPGLDGPETREYGSMAVHLYARPRPAAGAERETGSTES